jgi:ubiquitin C-terminal hydrolase
VRNVSVEAIKVIDVSVEKKKIVEKVEEVKGEKDEEGWSQVVSTKKKKNEKVEKTKAKRKQSRGKENDVKVLSTCSVRRSMGMVKLEESASPVVRTDGEGEVEAVYSEDIHGLLEKFLKSIGGQDAVGVQEDAQEFLQFLLETMHQELANVMSSSNIQPKDVVDDQKDDGWLEVGTGNKKRVVKEDINLKVTPISTIFGGTMQILLKKQGSKESVSYQPFFSLPLPLEEENSSHPINSLEEALDSFKSVSAIDGLRSESTSLSVRATKQCILSSIGSSIIFHFKRFSYSNGRAYKLNHFVEFPFKFTIQIGRGASEQHLQLSLRGIIVHHGNSPRKGHYSSFCRLSDDLWYHFDDTRVTQVEESLILEQQAYLLFYERI